jgi:hypothetical protein
MQLVSNRSVMFTVLSAVVLGAVSDAGLAQSVVRPAAPLATLPSVSVTPGLVSPPAMPTLSPSITPQPPPAAAAPAPTIEHRPGGCPEGPSHCPPVETEALKGE